MERQAAGNRQKKKKKKRTRKILDTKHSIDVEKKLPRPYHLSLIIMQINVNQNTRRLF